MRLTNQAILHCVEEARGACIAAARAQEYAREAGRRAGGAQMALERLRGLVGAVEEEGGKGGVRALVRAAGFAGEE